MSKFLTPPVYYDSKGNLVEILKGISQDGSVAIGKESSAYTSSVVIGNSSQGLYGYGVSIGASSSASSQYSIAIGYGTTSTGIDENGAIAIGKGTKLIGSNSIAIGNDISIGNLMNPENNVVQIGKDSITYTTFKVGNKDVFTAINAATSAAGDAASTFFIGSSPYKATYDSNTASLNFIRA